jgi:hypothetical protein
MPIVEPWDFSAVVLTRVRQKVVCDVLGCTSQAVRTWEIDLKEMGAIDDNKCYDLVKIIRWRLDKNKKKETSGKDELEMEKLRKEIEYKESQIIKIKENYIERNLYERYITSIFVSLRNFLEKVPQYWKHKFHMITSEVAEKRLMDMVRMSLEEIATGDEKISETIKED